MPNSNYVENKDGFYKKPTSVVKGNADYYTRPAPPVRDSLGHPIKNGKTDWARVIRENNEAHNGS